MNAQDATAPRRSIRMRLILLIVCAMSATGALTALFAGWTEARRQTRLEVEHWRAAAAVIAASSGEAFTSLDELAGFRRISAIARMPGATYGRLQFPDGRLLAETGAGVRLTNDSAIDVSAADKLTPLDLLITRTLQVTAPVFENGAEVGQVVMVVRLSGVGPRLLSAIGVSALGALCAAFLGVFVALRMGARISGPIAELSDAMRKVQTSHDYSVSVAPQGNDEVGDLAIGFNRMLADIRQRDELIARHVEHLEDEVASRTADLRVARDFAEAANRAKSDFLATMSHEIRTPMNGILALADILQRSELPNRAKRYADVIAQSGRSLVSIINDILDFSKIEAGKLELERVELDLADAADDVVALFAERARSKGLDIAAYVDPRIPMIVGDPVRMRQIIGNLVNNAIKFTEAGGVRVEITLEGFDRVLIAVVDTGVGVPEDKLESLFEAFTQADQSTTRRFGGTGLGLSICKRLAEAMNGAWRLSSAVGEGSTFALCIPIEPARQAAPWPSLPSSAIEISDLPAQTARALVLYCTAAASDSSAPASTLLTFSSATSYDGASENTIVLCHPDEESALAQRGALTLQLPVRQSDMRRLLGAASRGESIAGLLHNEPSQEKALAAYPSARVLVADDNEVNREVALEALAQFGIRPHLVEDGWQALHAATNATYDLILMDGSMPGLDGFAAASKIRQHEQRIALPATAIVALTAHVVGAGADAWRTAGMNDVLHKPFTLAALAATLRTYLGEGEVSAPMHEAAPAATVESRAVELFDPTIRAELDRMARSGRADFVERVTGLYLENAPAALKSLKEAQTQGDAEAAARAAHALKSMSLSMGASRVATAAAQCEHSARGQAHVDAHQLETLQEALGATLAALGGVSSEDAAPDPSDAIRAALARNEFRVVYQPQVDRAQTAVCGVEALIRWQSQRGEVSPEQFVREAETTGTVELLTDFVLDCALRECRNGSYVVGVNVSATEFAEPRFVTRVLDAVSKHAFDPRRLELEITETAVLEQPDRTLANMRALQQHGVRIALDDFGVGYTSLNHLRTLPFDALKIDRAFVVDCPHSIQATAVIHAVISVGRALGMKVIAEGVETIEQMRFLKVAGVHIFQGYYFGAPDKLDTALSCPVQAVA